MKYFSGLALFHAALFSVTVSGVGAPRSATPSANERWSLENVALTPSPKVIWGRLENGLRYAIMPHASPPGRVSLRLVVNVGSLDENNRERGYAHFVEHMAFVGTTHFPPGELIRFLQRQGAVFGPHVNAVTTNTSTVYKLELPGNSIGAVEDGLRIFRDYADGILFDPAEVEREKGVVLSERQFRQTDEEAELGARTALLFGGTLVPDREPIGLISMIEKADARSLKKFYRTWYRPEYMSVVVVGEIDPAEAEKLIRDQFGSVAGRGYSRSRPNLGPIKPPSEPQVSAYVTESKNFELSVIKVARGTAVPPTWGSLLKGLRLQSAFAMLARRLDRLSQMSNPSLNKLTATAEIEYGQFRVLSVQVSTDGTDWENALAVVEQEVRRVIELGFRPDELAFQKNYLRTLFENSARAFPTQPSTKIAETIADAMEGYGPFTFTGENLPNDLAMVDRLTAVDCQSAFREHWGASAPRIFITAGAAEIPSAKAVRTAYAASQRVAVSPSPPVVAPVFAYENFGPPGAIVEKTYVADLDLWLVRLANGVRLNLKHTAFETGLVRMKMRIGAGSFFEPPDKPGLRFWTGAWWAGGLGKHTLGELRLIGDGLGAITTGADEDALVLTSNARAECVPRALREVTALVADPAFRSDGHRATTAKLHSQLDPLWRSPEGPRQRFILPMLGGSRKGFPDPEKIFSRTLDEFRAWITPYLASGSLEFAMIGDFDVDAVMAEAAKTLGTLSPRPNPTEPLIEAAALHPQESVGTYYYSGPAERRSTLDIYWPVRDPLSGATRRQLTMLAAILSDRVRDEIRGKMGAAYSSHAIFFTSASYLGLAGIRSNIEVKPEDAQHYCDTIRDLAAELAAQGITADELARAKAQNLAALREAKTDNLFWLNNVLSEAQEHPEDLADLRSAENDVTQTSTADLDALARRYLGPEHAYRFIIEPSARKPKQN